MVSLVLHLGGGGGGKEIASSPKGFSFKDVVNTKASMVTLNHLPNVYIVDKIEEVIVLQVREEIVYDLFSYYESKLVIVLV